MLILLGLVLLVFLPDPWNVVAFVVCIPLFAGEIYLWNRTVRHKRPQVGAETLIGAAGVAITECAPDGQVRIGGTIWEARSTAPLATGDAVRVVSRDGLRLTVEPGPPR
jgi:membrane protein implicated in regulation of membrane protease activity